MDMHMNMIESIEVKAVNYGRESEGQKRSIRRQLEEGREEAERLGWSITREYQDEVGASRSTKKPRKDWPKLKRDIQAGEVNAVLLREASRGDRILPEWLGFVMLCADRKVLIHSVSTHRTFKPWTDSDYEQLANDGLRAEMEARKISERSLKGHDGSFRDGFPPVGLTPYGFVRHPYKDEYGEVRMRQSACPEKAPVVREIFEAAAEGVAFRAIVAQLNDEENGVKHPSGTKWNTQRLRVILRNKQYIGVRVRRPRDKEGRVKEVMETKGNWEPIVSASLFRKVQRRLDKQAGGVGRPGAYEPREQTEYKDKDGKVIAVKKLSRDWILSFAMCCDKCGERMVPGKGYEGQPRYQCSSREGCTSIYAVETEELVRQALSTVLFDRTFQNSIKDAVDEDDTEIIGMDNEIAALEERLATYQRMAADGDIEHADFSVIAGGIRTKLKALKGERVKRSVPASLIDILPELQEGEHLAHFMPEEEAALFVRVMERIKETGPIGERVLIRDVLDIRVKRAEARGPKAQPVRERIVILRRDTGEPVALPEES
jgi:DNA invertase Pin-like site-specific DNA recombinase